MCIVLCLLMLAGSGTPVAKLKVIQPTEQALFIQSLALNVDIDNDAAVTTYDLTYFNANDRDLEARLEFPLPGDAFVTRFAMEVDGQLREGVVVDKAKGRQAYDEIVSMKVDPGLVEQVQGRDFRADVYPVPARDSKRLVIEILEVLPRDHRSWLYRPPVRLSELIKQGQLTINLKGSITQQKILGSYSNLRFTKTGNGLSMTTHLEQFPNDLEIEISSIAKLWRNDCDVNGSHYFRFVIPTNDRLTKVIKPTHISLFWDVSGSAMNRNRQKEWQLIESYLKQEDEVEVTVVPFSYHVEEVAFFTIQDGKTRDLEAFLMGLLIDGASCLGAVNFNNYHADLGLLVTDAVDTFCEDIPVIPSFPMHALASVPNVDTQALWQIVSLSGGRVIDLTASSVSQIADQLNHVSSVSDFQIHPLDGVPHIRRYTDSIEVIGKTQAETIAVRLQEHRFGPISLAGTESPWVAVLWANAEIARARFMHADHADSLRDIAIEFGLVTAFTSLIVLEDAWQYALYGIEPPPELLEDFEEALEDMADWEADQIQDSKENREAIQSEYDDLREWYAEEFTIPPLRPSQKVAEKAIKTHEWYTSVNYYLSSDPKNSGLRIKVICEQGDALPGVSIQIDNQQGNRSAVTDINGEAFINPDAGVYSMGAFMPGFNSVTFNDLKINADLQTLVTVVMRYASVEECLVVTASPATILLKVKPYDTDTHYINALLNLNDQQIQEQYAFQRAKYAESPSFYLDVASLLFEKQLGEMGHRVLSNLAELTPDTHNTLTLLAMHYRAHGYNWDAIWALAKVTMLRPDLPQAWRQLALAYLSTNEYQLALDLFDHVITGSWPQDPVGIGFISLEEKNALVAARKNLQAANPNLGDEPMHFDLRFCLTWDTPNSTVDLWVTDPRGEKCYYGNVQTKSGARYLYDIWQSYGPQVILVKKAIPGVYRIEANLYGDARTSLFGPISVQADIFRDYGRDNQKQTTRFLRFDEHNEINDQILIAEITIE